MEEIFNNIVSSGSEDLKADNDININNNFNFDLNKKLALVNANIHTSKGTVNSLVIESGRISWLGNMSELHLNDEFNVIDLDGRTVLPGFCDAHAGLLKWALSEEGVGLEDLSGLDYELLAKLFKVYSKKAANLGVTEIWTDDILVFNNNFNDMQNFFASQVATSEYMPIRLRNYININNHEELLEFINSGFSALDGVPFCHVGPVKILCDGVKPEVINKLIYTAHLAGLQIAAQAGSGAALNMCLDAFENAFNARALNTRHLIIHAKAADLNQLKRMKDLRLGAVIEPEMAVRSDAGCRWREMLRSGITFCAGSGAGLNSYGDNKKADINPMHGLYYAVNRQELDGEALETHNALECLSVAEAVEAYTYSAAWNCNNEKRRGEIALWRDADLVVLNKDPFKVEPDELKNLSVYITICAGRIIEQESEQEF